MSKKKQVRAQFRNAVFTRDGNKCRVCSWVHTPAIREEGLDAHHITDRNELPNGGYVKENGIALCPDCHKKAEVFHLTGESVDGFSPDELYTLIGSSFESAINASKKLA